MVNSLYYGDNLNVLRNAIQEASNLDCFDYTARGKDF